MKNETVIRISTNGNVTVDEKEKSGMVKQVIPSDQVKLILRALRLLKTSIELMPKEQRDADNINYDHFDIITLIGLLQGEVSVEHPKVIADAFSFHYEGVDFPDYGDEYPLIEL
jgi:hypothetical protein